MAHAIQAVEVGNEGGTEGTAVASAAAGGVPGPVEAEIHQSEQGQGFGQRDWGWCGKFLIKNVRLGEPQLGVTPLNRVVGD